MAPSYEEVPSTDAIGNLHSSERPLDDVAELHSSMNRHVSQIVLVYFSFFMLGILPKSDSDARNGHALAHVSTPDCLICSLVFVYNRSGSFSRDIFFLSFFNEDLNISNWSCEPSN